MLPYLIRRLAAFVPVLWAAGTLAFVGLRLTPGNPADALYAEAQIAPSELAARRAALGLNRPLTEQYLQFLRDLLRGQLGASIFTGRPVTTMILEQAGATAQLAAAGLGAAVALGLLLGVTAAVRPDTLIERALIALAALSQSLPVAWTGLLALWLAARALNTGAAGLLLPAAVLGFASAGPIAGLTRASLSAARGELHVIAARARGLHGWRLTWHALRAALVPVIHLTALQAAFLFGGTVVTETVFARPGLGRLLVDALLRKDIPVVQGLVLGVAALYLAFNLLADIAAALLDPRLRFQWR